MLNFFRILKKNKFIWKRNNFVTCEEFSINLESTRNYFILYKSEVLEDFQKKLIELDEQRASGKIKKNFFFFFFIIR